MALIELAYDKIQEVTFVEYGDDTSDPHVRCS
jgi:hypothetical protein